MAPERDEGRALTRLIALTIDGKRVDIPVLSIADTDDWLGFNGQVVSGLTVENDEDPGVMLANAMRAGTEAAIASLMRYDTQHVLGDRDAIRQSATPAELHAALEVVYEAALPFDSDAARSVAAAFGGPTRLAMTIVAMAMTRLSDLLPAPSMPSPSSAGASGGTRSAANGRRNSSSSAGRTATTSRTRKRSKPGTSLQTV